LEDELERPVLVADRMILGSIARTLVMEHRVFRRCSERGVSTPAGDVRPTLPEFRALAQLKAQLLGKLRFRRTPKALDDLRDAWRSAAPVGAGAAIAPEAGQDDADAPEATP
jgi:hypothetical protein